MSAWSLDWDGSAETEIACRVLNFSRRIEKDKQAGYWLAGQFWYKGRSPSLFSFHYHLPPFITIRMTPT
jgi:hypothetical protein